MARSIFELDDIAFGQVAESVYVHGNYPDVKQDVDTRILEAGEAIGRACVVRVVHDGEVGHQIAVIPKKREIFDPVAQGV